MQSHVMWLLLHNNMQQNLCKGFIILACKSEQFQYQIRNKWLIPNGRENDTFDYNKFA